MNRTMRWLCGWALVLLLSAPLSGQEKASSALVVNCDRPDALYKIGETAKFLYKSKVAGELKYRLSQDGFSSIKDGKIQVEAGKVYSMTGTLDKPGFLQLQMIFEGKVSALAAAAFEPTKIEPTAQVPADFEAFWKKGLEELAQVPMDPKMERSDKYSNDFAICYRVSLGNIEGKRVHGWLAVPIGKGPFPAVLTLPGAGVYGINPDTGTARLGALSMNIIIHDLPVDEPKTFYDQQKNGALKNYRDIGWDNKDKNYYRAVILGCVRCLDFLTHHPEYNGKDLAVTGGSQGGALTLITSGLDSRVKLASPNVAAMCDHSGKTAGRVSGWPHWLDRSPEDKAAKVAETAAYYDAVNFARKFKGKSLHGVGFIDTVCAPTTVYAAFNVHPEPKKMINSPLMGHGTDPVYLKARDDFWRKNMDLKPPTGK